MHPERAASVHHHARGPKHAGEVSGGCRGRGVLVVGAVVCAELGAEVGLGGICPKLCPKLTPQQVGIMQDVDLRPFGGWKV